ncbi:hypothetical protein M758_6G115100 [Ceratodon purpureus]|uniref:Uncharacterized protein n=1 Tax=Ceratodon purpureus TaxID=3225 RepID=A0A8T0HE64_CERPU|nr:hypothetical protein KC19_6G119900 [Ceratodon purpureus]KAG0613604.1 hypothetical protein M758_6G115100 [Ceratodon purpureus]
MRTVVLFCGSRFLSALSAPNALSQLEHTVVNFQVLLENAKQPRTIDNLKDRISCYVQIIPEVTAHELLKKIVVAIELSST